jgi:AcrR family transcriptional regulator
VVVVPALQANSLGELVARYSPAKRRTVDAALQLFAEHGVGGTSLQTIADVQGLTKAAVYHQFRTKDEIVLAVIEVQLAPLEKALAGVSGARSGPERRDQLLTAVIDVVVTNRSSLSTLQSDPVLFRLLGEHPPSRRLWRDLFAELLGRGLDDRARIRASVISAILGTVSFPLVVEIDDATLRDELLRITRPLLAD